MDEEQPKVSNLILGHLDQIISIYNTYPPDTSSLQAYTLFLKMVLYSQGFDLVISI